METITFKYHITSLSEEGIDKYKLCLNTVSQVITSIYGDGGSFLRSSHSCYCILQRRKLERNEDKL